MISTIADHRGSNVELLDAITGLLYSNLYKIFAQMTPLKMLSSSTNPTKNIESLFNQQQILAKMIKMTSHFQRRVSIYYPTEQLHHILTNLQDIVLNNHHAIYNDHITHVIKTSNITYHRLNSTGKGKEAERVLTNLNDFLNNTTLPLDNTANQPQFYPIRLQNGNISNSEEESINGFKFYQVKFQQD